MEKLHALLNESTFLNLKLIYQLITRYKFLLLIACTLFCGVFVFNLYSQPIIYAIEAPLKTVTSQKVSNDLTSLLPSENVPALTFEELNINLSSYSFMKTLANLMVKHKDFDSLDFGSTKSTKSLTGRDLAKGCASDTDCIAEHLILPIRELYFLEIGPTESRFKLTINAIKPNTTKALISVLEKAVESERIKVRQYSVLKEIKSVQSLITESRAMMISLGGQSALEEHEKLHSNINELKERIKQLHTNLSNEQINGSTLQARLLENKKTTLASEASQENYDNYQKVDTRLKNIKMDLLSLVNIPDEKRTPSDRLIISQLLSEKTKLLKSIPAEHLVKSIFINESFKEKQRENFDNYEFDYFVSKNKIAKLKENYDESKNELNLLLQKNMVNEEKITGMKGDLAFLKGLEEKQMTLKLLNATMASDLIFESNSGEINQFRKSSHFKILLLSLSITLLTYLITLLGLYSSDDKIYGEEDVRMYFKQLDFVGEVPSFD